MLPAWGLIAIAALELVLGLCLILRIAPRFTAWTALAVALVFCTYHLASMFVGHNAPSCRCLGDFVRGGQAAASMVAAVMLLLATKVVIEKET